MNHIALCGNTAPDTRLIKELIHEHQQHLTQEYRLQTFTSSSSLLHEVNRGKHFSLYILDTALSPLSGIELGKIIRQEHNDAALIYVSASKEPAFDAFEILAQRYLLKPLDKERFFEALTFCLTRPKTPCLKRFPLKTHKGITNIPFKSILFAECSSRTLSFTCQNGSVLTGIFMRKSFEAEAAPLLEDPAFIQPHKSYIVNLEHIETLTGTHFLLSNNTRIPLARNRYREAKKRYLEFSLSPH